MVPVLRCPKTSCLVEADPVLVTVPLTVPKRFLVKVTVLRFFTVPSMIVLLSRGVGCPRVRVD